jgi:hypothetical protein
MLKLKLSSVLLIVALLLSACAQKSEAEVQKCIVGTWQLSGNEAFGRAVLPPGSFDQDGMSFVDAGGVVGYSFDEKGKVYVDVLAWMSQFLVEMDQQKLPLDLQIMGEAVGSYSLDGDRIRVTALDHSDLAFEAFLDGDSMMKTLVANEFAPLFVTAYPVAQFECSETTLSLTILEQPGLTAPIEFERVSQD